MNNAGADVAARLKVIRSRAAGVAPKAAVEAVSQAGETLTKLALSKRSHPKGTPTPSPKGAPPALVSGDLRRSVRRTPATMVGSARFVQVLGSRLIYAPVHEFGPVTITAKRFPQLGNPQAGFFGPQVTIPSRPWMRPSVELLITSGTATKTGALAFLAALDT